MAEQNTYDFKELKRGDSFYPSINGSESGLRFRYRNKNGVGYDGLDITIQFKTQDGFLAQTFSTTPNPEHILIERLGNGEYRIKTHIIKMRPNTYYHDWEAKWPEPIDPSDNSKPTISTKTGRWVISQDISNS